MYWGAMKYERYMQKCQEIFEVIVINFAELKIEDFILKEHIELLNRVSHNQTHYSKIQEYKK